ncbi:hypothetical protein P5673_026340 [Acropora cervicornis]|uniref:TIR domain-containing protein n=1 Tax=Acropora cervicornis TaxID=6130 RepID=A0AAD9Q0X0_ACRCE|nr:hypothetical protein P5673_026340 [Acropora cervicornis]
MGCTPSSQISHTNDNERRLLLEIDRLRTGHQSQEQEIDRLRQENEKLKQKDLNGTFEIADRHDDDDEKCNLLVKEIERLKLEKEEKDKEIYELCQNNEELNIKLQQSPQVLAMWKCSPWQYFTARIVSFDVIDLQYTINWDDQDSSGRIVDYYNLALDRVPDPDEVAVGSIVLFPQGTYKGQEGVRLGGQRYHQGCITHVHEGPDGEKLYDGVHTKGEAEGKWITYKGYSPKFQGLKLSELRISPNVLDVLSSQDVQNSTGNNGVSTCDIFISFTKADSPSAIRNNEVSFQDRPPSYDEAMLSNFCDPREIRYQLEGCGVAVNEETQESGSLIQTVKQIESAKVFVACLSDDYVSGSFEWMMTVVGLLIAGEIYIHFQSKEVEHAKMSELLSAIKKSVPELKVPDEMENIQDLQQSSEDTDNKPFGPADIFIKQSVGSAFADPRKVHSILAQSDKFSLWIDTDQLKTTNQNDESLGMFAQIADGLGKAKVVLACVSKQYANSENCRMEIQFAIKDVNTEEELQLKALEIQKAILPLLGLEENTRSYRAPVVGDHVISHHNKWAFFGATIASFNRETMTYTVNWDDGDPTDRVQSYRDSTGLPQYDGHHTKGADDGKWVTYREYQYNFTGIPLTSLRIAPNAMDALMACQEAFS